MFAELYTRDVLNMAKLIAHNRDKLNERRIF